MSPIVARAARNGHGNAMENATGLAIEGRGAGMCGTVKTLGVQSEVETQLRLLFTITIAAVVWLTVLTFTNAPTYVRIVP